MTTDKSVAVTLPNSEQFSLWNEKGEEYIIQISWPLKWAKNYSDNRGPLPFIYIVDGNAAFLTATEAAWRLEFSPYFAGGGIVVAIGYPCTGIVFDARRNYDLTPPTSDAGDTQGGACVFAEFIANTVRPAVKAKFPRLSCSREALFGYSYGGLFALHLLLTRSESFDFYIASSPSVWWGDRHILRRAESFARPGEVGNGKLPSLLLSVGSLEQCPPQRTGEAVADYEKRKQMWADLNMVGNVHDLTGVLRGCPRLGGMEVVFYEGEEHTSIVASSLNRGLTVFFEDWPRPGTADDSTGQHVAPGAQRL